MSGTQPSNLSAAELGELRGQVLLHWENLSGLLGVLTELESRGAVDDPFVLKLRLQVWDRALALRSEQSAPDLGRLLAHPLPEEHTEGATEAEVLDPVPGLTEELSEPAEPLTVEPQRQEIQRQETQRQETQRREIQPTGERPDRAEPRLESSEDWRWEAPDLGRPVAARDEHEYELHLAAIEWGLDPAILIQRAEDIQARRHWQDTLEPFEHQVRNLITFCRRAPVALLADDVGLGKTISAGLILSELVARKKVTRALVIAPKLLLPQWKEELESKFRLRATHAVAEELRGLLRGEGLDDWDVLATTYHSARSAMDQIIRAGFDLVILDEAHHLRNLVGTQNPPRLAVEIERALKQRAFRYVIMLTATPIQNRLWDLYSLVHLLSVAKGHENPLGSQDQFHRRYIADSRAEARVLREEARGEFRNILSQYMVRTRRVDCGLLFPERRVSTQAATPEAGEVELMHLVGRIIQSMNPLAQTSVAQALMSSPEALVDQLRRMAENGTVEPGLAGEAERIARGIARTGKLRALMDLSRSLARERPDDWRMVVFTGRRETQRAIGEALVGEFGEHVVGFIRGGDPEGNQETIRRYSSVPPQARVVVSTDAGAEGVNLQAGNVVANYDLPWNPMIVEQRIGRVQRLGSEFANVVVLNLVLAGSVEERVVARLSEKLAAVASTIGDIEGILEALPGQAGRDGGLEAQIRSLVVDSLAGRDVGRSVELATQSIDRARTIYQSEQRTVEEHLGTLDALHSEGPRMPALESLAPRLPETEFTLRALRAEGGSLEALEEGIWLHERPGHAPEQVVFSREDAGRRHPDVIAQGPNVGLYLSGQPAFEQLVGRWQARGEHLVDDVRGTALEERGLREALGRWAARFPAVEVLEVRPVATRVRLQARLVARAALSTEHDRFEKLVEVDYRPDGHETIADLADADLERPARLDLTDDAHAIRAAVQDAVHADRDLASFGGFYVERRAEELARAGGRPELEQLARDRFTPRAAARLVGTRGVTYHEHDVEVSLRVAGEGDYGVAMTVVPVTGQVRSAPDEGTCTVTGETVPANCLAVCDVTGRSALRHELVVSERSGRVALPSEAVHCDVSGRHLLADEVAPSDVSGRVVDLELLESSEVSGRRGLADELARCAFTEARVGHDELATSQVSGRRFRRDQSAIGGDAGVLGHVSEFETCEVSKRLCLPAEMCASDVSGRRVHRSSLFASELDPSRYGLSIETVMCQETGRRLLTDEVACCTVTGKTVGVDLLEASSSTGELALATELLTCQVTGARLLPRETGECTVSGKLVDVRLLERSEVCGAWALGEHLARCEETGQSAFADELEVCQQSGKRVLRTRLRTCAVTGRRVSADLLVENDLDRSSLLAEYAARSEKSGRVCAQHEIRRCAWTGSACLPDEVEQELATGAWVDRDLLDDEGRLVPLVDLLHGRHAGQPGLPDGLDVHLDPLLRARKLYKPCVLPAPSGQWALVTAEERRLLGVKLYQVGWIVEDTGVRLGGLLELDRKSGKIRLVTA